MCLCTDSVKHERANIDLKHDIVSVCSEMMFKTQGMCFCTKRCLSVSMLKNNSDYR